ncbi:MAG: hypothetical protein H6Q58_1475 [Firmicutes bacterium]|nr:hypothetical protein [Bacillota bacterium]
MKKKKKLAPVLILTLLAVFNVIVFSLPITNSPLFWAAYTITSVAIVLIAAYLLGLLTGRKRAETKRPEEEIKVNKFFLNTIQVYVNVLNMKNKNEELAAELKELSDAIQGSEPISCGSLEGIEEKIKQAFGGLQKLVEDGRTAEAKEACGNIKEMLEERNSMCREIKM